METRGSVWIEEKAFPLRRQSSIGTNCTERVHNLSIFGGLWDVTE